MDKKIDKYAGGLRPCYERVYNRANPEFYGTAISYDAHSETYVVEWDSGETETISSDDLGAIPKGSE